MALLHMETDLVREAVAQIQRAASTIETNNQQLNSAVQNLMGSWQGPVIGIFANEFHQISQQLAILSRTGTQMQTRLHREIDEWERVGSTFGAGSGVYSKEQRIQEGISIESPLTANGHEDSRVSLESQADIYNLINENKKSEPIKIIQIGENDYLVTIAGTDSEDFSRANNWTHAFTSGMGLPGDYEIEVKEFITNNIPPGASIHLTGHSQGGIVANNLADSADFATGYEIESVTTYGAPISARPLEGATYKRFAAEGDPVPYLQAYYAPDLLGDESMQQIKVDTAVDSVFNFSDAHGSYDQLTNENLHSFDSYMTVDPAYMDSGYITPEIPPQDTTTAMGQINQGGAAIYGKGNQIIGDAIAGHIERTGDFFNLNLNVRDDIDNMVDRLNRGLLDGAGKTGDRLQNGLIDGSQAVIDVAEKNINTAANLLDTVF